MKWKIKGFFVKLGIIRLFIALVACLSIQAFAVSTTEIKEWPAQFLDDVNEGVGDELNDQGHKLSVSIFESITDRELFDYDFGFGSLSVDVKREVYNNHTVIDSWTVVDYMSVPISIPFYASPTYNIGAAGLGLQLQSTIGLNIVNIRQVLPSNINSLPSPDDLSDVGTEVDDLGKSIFAQDEDQEGIVHEVTEVTREDDDGFSIPDFLIWGSAHPERRARFSRFWNLLLGPYKLPFSQSAFNRLNRGEIVSYSLDGSVQLGASIGWSLTGLREDPTTVGASAATYLQGRYQISVMKEAENKAKVKLTKVYQKGRSYLFGADTPKWVIFKGFTIFGKETGRLREKIIPFSLQLGKSHSDIFDVGYRYDLNNPQAKKAYLKAVLGRFKLSEELSANTKETGVEKAFTRTQDRTRTSNSYEMEIAFFLENERASISEDVHMVVTLPTGTKKIFKSISTNAQAIDTIWGHSEDSSYSFNTTIEPAEYNSTDDKGMELRIEAQFSDRRTYGKEMRAYIQEVENATGQIGLFPRPPQFEPILEHVTECFKQGPRGRKVCRPKVVESNFGKSSFYYRLSISRKQLEKFINFPKEEMWGVIEKAFRREEGTWSTRSKRAKYIFKNLYASALNFPLKLVNMNIKRGNDLKFALSFYKTWNKLKKIELSSQIRQEASSLFSTPYYSAEIIDIFKRVLDGEEISYYLNARNGELFGQISRSENDVEQYDEFAREIEREVDFDRIGPRNNVDEKATLEEFDLVELDENTVMVSFVLPDTPKYLYWRVDKTSYWTGYKNLMTLVEINKDQYTRGSNTIIVRRDDTEGIKGKLSQAIFTDSYNTLMLAITLNGNDWGAVSSKSFRIREGL